jgi:hypothetical protein
MNQQWQQDQMRRQQEMMRQQQEQLRKQQMMAAWMEQQKTKDASNQTANEVSQAVSYIRQEFKAKRISREQAEDRLRQQIIQDPAGTLWTVGFQSGKWYHRYGDRWVKADPSFAPQAAVAKQAQNNWGKAIGTFIGGIFLTLLFAYIAALIASEIASSMGNYYDSSSYAGFAGVVVVIIGLWVTISKTKKAFSGK